MSPFGTQFNNAHFSKLQQSEERTKIILDWVKKESGIFFWGAKAFGENIGNGKTYFCACLYNYLTEKKENVRAYGEIEYYTILKEAISKNWDYNFEARRICEAKWLIIDDLGTSKISEFTKECVYTMIDTRLNSGLPTLITTNLTLGDIQENYGSRVLSRINSVKNVVVLSNDGDRRKNIFD